MADVGARVSDSCSFLCLWIVARTSLHVMHPDWAGMEDDDVKRRIVSLVTNES